MLLGMECINLYQCEFWLQDGSDTICHGVDTLNTETLEVRYLVCSYSLDIL